MVLVFAMFGLLEGNMLQVIYFVLFINYLFTPLAFANTN